MTAINSAIARTQIPVRLGMKLLPADHLTAVHRAQFRERNHLAVVEKKKKKNGRGNGEKRRQRRIARKRDKDNSAKLDRASFRVIPRAFAGWCINKISHPSPSSDSREYYRSVVDGR